MNQLTSQQRKLVYLAGIVVLTFPILWLGLPATGEEDSGGKLAQMRQEYDLGETNLGKVDPSSATMNLVLLGLRGVAANLLWMEHDELKKTKNWAQMRAVTESIITLQPHFRDVWRFHGWDLAYNVSAEWDAVADRWYWVKEGGKFTMEGAARNRKFAELLWDVGRILGQKIGRADEKAFFRDYFLKDPDEDTFEGGPDPALSRVGTREFTDNYLAARHWFQLANDVEQLHGQSIMMRLLFRHYPVRSMMDYADALMRGTATRDPVFEEITEEAWRQAYDELTTVYGREEYDSPGGTIMLEATEEDLPILVEKDGGEFDEETKRHWIIRYQNVGNYLYWRRRAQLESEPEMVAAHRELYEGRKAFWENRVFWDSDGTPPESLQRLESGMQRLADLLEVLEQSDESREAARDSALIEEAMMAVLYWQRIHDLNGRPIPDQFPLKKLWDANQDVLPQVEDEFKRESRQ